MSKIYILYDILGRFFKRLDIFPNDLVAFREYSISLESFIKDNPFINFNDYKIYCIGTIDNASDKPVISLCHYEVTTESIREYLKTHPIGDK